MQPRWITDAEAAEIRAGLPYGPPWQDHCHEIAERLGVLPVSIARLWAGLTFDRARAYPKGHPRRQVLNAKLAADQRIRDKIKKLDISAIGEKQGWHCVYCRVALTGKLSPNTQGSAYAHDHIIPLNPHSGQPAGATAQENIQLLCRTCNHRKSNMSDAEFRAVLPRMQAAKQRQIDFHRQRECRCRFQGCYPDCAGCPLCEEFNSDPAHPDAIICPIVDDGSDEFGFDWMDCSTQEQCRAAGRCAK